MAYYNKYKITFATKTSKTAYLYLQEDLATAPTVIEYPGIDLQLQYLPESDDPFEPIFASQLGVSIDVTDDLANIPNFTTANDRKYFVKLYLGADLEWTGFTISDDVQISFTTGRKGLTFNCVDGIGMLQSLILPITNNVDINDLQTLLYYLRTALNALDLPTTPNIRTACSYYAATMTNRSTSTSADPFAQTYLPYRTFLDGAYNYLNCYDVVKNILKSFGCRLFMANGKWWIVAINEFASENVAYTEYTYAGAVATSGTFNTLSVIQGYTGNTSNLFFTENNQMKLLKKGFNRVESLKVVEAPINFFSNGNLRPSSSDIPSNWLAAYNGSGSSYVIQDVATNATATYKLVKSNVTGAYVWIVSTGMPFVNGGEVLNFKWTYFSQDLTGYRGNVYIKIIGATQTYYWDGTQWSTNASLDNFSVPEYKGGANNYINDYSFSTTLCPIPGELYFKLELEAGTCNNIEVGNFILTMRPLLKEVSYTAYTDSTKQYTKSVDIPYGFYATGTYATDLGAFVNTSNAPLVGWYQYGRATSYPSLTQLIMQLYINVFGKNIINIDCNLTSFDTNNGLLNASKLFKATDTDPSSINVASNSYMLGNATIDYVADTTQSTLLQISNTDITCTNSYVISYNTIV
jgi:hypothetical protein